MKHTEGEISVRLLLPGAAPGTDAGGKPNAGTVLWIYTGTSSKIWDGPWRIWTGCLNLEPPVTMEDGCSVNRKEASCCLSAGLLQRGDRRQAKGAGGHLLLV